MRFFYAPPARACRLPELLSERVRGLPGRVKADGELLVVGRSDREPIRAERPHLHVGRLLVGAGQRWVTSREVPR